MNDFSQDANCKALWNFESGAVPFLADSKGGNTLVNQGVAEDTEDYKQGLCSAAFIRANTDRFYVLNTNLDSGFPLKYGESNKTFSYVFWAKFTGTITDRQVLGGFWSNYSTRIELQNSKMQFDTGNGSAWIAIVTHDTALVTGRWYHVGITYDNADYTVRIRIWDDTAQAIVGTDKVDYASDAGIGSNEWSIGSNITNYAQEGNQDEFIVFDDVLTVGEIDQIRAGTYGGGGQTVLDYERKTRGVGRGVCRGAA